MDKKTALRCVAKTFWKNNSMPEYVTLYVTSKCNCKCKHCFYWQELNKKEQELSVEELQKLSKTTGNFSLLILTGGEPFLRKDLPEIAELFCKNNSVENVLIPTNGFDTKTVCAATKNLLEKCGNASVVVNVSIDAIGRQHDKIRGAKGIFKNAMQTFEELKKLKGKFKNLGVGFNVTHFSENEKQLEKTIDFLIEQKPDSVSLGLVRGNLRSEKDKKVDLQLHDALCRRIIQEMRSGKMRGHSLAGSKFLSKLRIANTEMIYNDVVATAKTGKMPHDCFAGTINAVIYSNGDVFPCELLEKKIGNLRDSNFDFKKLWKTKAAGQIREFIRKKNCACTQECIITTNLLFNPLCLIKMGLKSV